MPTTPPAFLILDDALEHAGRGAALTLDGEEGRHAAKVARIGVGEQILLTDAAGRAGDDCYFAFHVETLPCT